MFVFLFLEKSFRCYERRMSCLKQRGWCKTGPRSEFGFCSEINEISDTPNYEHPLFEVPTFVFPKTVSHHFFNSSRNVNLVFYGKKNWGVKCWAFYFISSDNKHCLDIFIPNFISTKNA